jgi:hypothetical protein
MRKSYRPSAMRAQGHRIQALVAWTQSPSQADRVHNLNRQTQLPRYRSYSRARRCNSTTQSIVPAPFPLQETRIVPKHTRTHISHHLLPTKLQSPNVEVTLPSLNHAPPALSPVPPSNLYTFHSNLATSIQPPMPAPNTHHATVHAHFARAPSPALLRNQEAANRPRAVDGKAQRAGRQGFASLHKVVAKPPTRL